MKTCQTVLVLGFLRSERVTGSAVVSAHGQPVVLLGDLKGGVLGERRLVFVSQVDAQSHLSHGGQVLEALEACRHKHHFLFRLILILFQRKQQQWNNVQFEVLILYMSAATLRSNM